MPASPAATDTFEPTALELERGRAFAELRRKARYGHRSYVYWTDREGALRWAPYGRDGIKAAILAVGAKGRFSLLDEGGVSTAFRSLRSMLLVWRNARLLAGRPV
jgi:hypothetical protein